MRKMIVLLVAAVVTWGCAGPMQTPPDLVPAGEVRSEAKNRVGIAAPRSENASSLSGENADRSGELAGGLKAYLDAAERAAEGRAAVEHSLGPSASAAVSEGSAVFLLRVHEFHRSDTLRDLFARNRLFAVFDPPSLGDRKLSGDVFLTDSEDLVDFLEEVERLFVERIGPRSFIVRRCAERVYRLPTRTVSGDSRRFLLQVLALTDDESAWVRWVPDRRLLFVYDDRQGHERIEKFLKALTEETK
ncbi:hypothetical protein [Thermosulfurimonas sp. F29]|uniref:hypothetical protein n=1 Tax=Thermosulfurimonas sp. F29 TaxID=2867247 RepID=UPI001C82F407|nr:hypothetical protein [Thermosulfurimonas sp. F29]MBX6423384.1 hypothetical protein [Thermosulfurimonas sp. F29]